VFGVCGVGKNSHEMLIAPWAAAVFWRTGALSGDAGRIGSPVDRWLGFFHGDRMVPVVAEIVGVAEAGDAGSQQAVQGQAVFVVDVVGGAPVAILLPVNVEGMEVAITLGECQKPGALRREWDCLVAKAPVQHRGPDLKYAVGAAGRPAHLPALVHAGTHQLVDGALGP